MLRSATVLWKLQALLAGIDTATQPVLYQHMASSGHQPTPWRLPPSPNSCREALANKAAQRAAAINNMSRCGSCEACQMTNGRRRRCLLVRACAAAAAGHVGAQLAVLGEKALGARLDVYWPLDQERYQGTVGGWGLAGWWGCCDGLLAGCGQPSVCCAQVSLLCAAHRSAFCVLRTGQPSVCCAQVYALACCMLMCTFQASCFGVWPPL